MRDIWSETCFFIYQSCSAIQGLWGWPSFTPAVWLSFAGFDLRYGSGFLGWYSFVSWSVSRKSESQSLSISQKFLRMMLLIFLSSCTSIWWYLSVSSILLANSPFSSSSSLVRCKSNPTSFLLAASYSKHLLCYLLEVFSCSRRTDSSCCKLLISEFFWVSSRASFTFSVMICYDWPLLFLYCCYFQPCSCLTVCESEC